MEDLEHFEEEFVNRIVSVIKTKLIFFQIKVKSVFSQASRAVEWSSKIFNAVNE